MSDWQLEAEGEMWDAIVESTSRRAIMPEPIRRDDVENAIAAGERAQAAASIRASVERDSWNAVGMRAEIGECGYPTREPAA